MNRKNTPSQNPVSSQNPLPRILIVEDTKEHAQWICAALGDRVEATLASTMEEARQAIAKNVFDIALLDLMLPDGDGFQVCSLLRSHPDMLDIPVLILSSKDDVRDKVSGFTIGADDYITKPCPPEELRARVFSRLQRKPTTEGLKLPDLEINFLRQTAILKMAADEPRELDLTPREFKLLCFLARNANTIMSRDMILKHVWGGNVYVSNRSIDTHVASLRRKLKTASRYIHSIHSVGYSFSTQDDFSENYSIAQRRSS